MSEDSADNSIISKERLFYLPLYFLGLSIIKLLVGGYYYPQQDNTIYLTFRDAARYPENFAKDIFASLHQTHFDFLWPILELMPDDWLWEPNVVLVSIILNALFFGSLYYLCYTLTKNYWASFLPLVFCIWPKYLQGFGMYTAGFMHRVIVFCLVNLALALYLRGKNSLALALLAFSTYLYPPLIYFVWPVVAIAAISELGFKRAALGGLFSLVLISPLLYSYYDQGVFAGLLGAGVQVDWKPYFLINLESIFTLSPFSPRKFKFLLSYLGMLFLCWFVIKSLASDMSAQMAEKRFKTLLIVGTGVSIVFSLITYLGLDIALKLQLIRMSRFVVLAALVGLTLPILRVWNGRSNLQRIAVFLSAMSASFFAVIIATLIFFQEKNKNVAPIFILLFLFVFFTHAVRIPILEFHKRTPWHDVALHAKENLETDSLTLIPPVAGKKYCEVDSNTTFRFLARRSTTLKLSDGVETGYNQQFAKLYKDYVNSVHKFLEIEPDFSSACNFRDNVKEAWDSKSVEEVLSYARTQGADYALLSNVVLGGKGGYEKSVFYRGREYSLLRTTLMAPPL